jgi:metal-dependent hydrolase (beta-lactamase superfamily II)
LKLDRLLRKPDQVKALLPGVHKLLSDESKNKIIEKLIRLNIKASHAMNDSDRDYLKKIFREDIIDTGTLLDKDLSHWTHSPADS